MKIERTIPETTIYCCPIGIIGPAKVALDLDTHIDTHTDTDTHIQSERKHHARVTEESKVSFKFSQQQPKNPPVVGRLTGKKCWQDTLTHTHTHTHTHYTHTPTPNPCYLMGLPRRDSSSAMDAYDTLDDVFLPQDFQPDRAMRTIGRCSVSTLPAFLLVWLLSCSDDGRARSPLLAGNADGAQVLPGGEGPSGCPHRHPRRRQQAPSGGMLGRGEFVH